MIGGEIWIPDKDLQWKLSTVIMDQGDNIVVDLRDSESTQKIVKKTTTLEFHSSHMVDDYTNICNLDNISEAPILDILRRRYSRESFCIYAADILISLNPYKNLTCETPLRYLDLRDHSHEDDEETEAELEPHPFAIANNSLRSLIFNSDERENNLKAGKIRVNQSLIVSGESGAGKTEVSKLIMDFLIESNHAMNSRDDEHVGVDFGEIGDKIKSILIESRLVFEAIGNAKNFRNDNASRFGKYIKLEYTEDNTLLAAYTETFLLEQPRLVSVGEGERNYHIFYRLVRGLQSTRPQLADALKVKNVEDFAILTGGGCTVITSEGQDVEEFRKLEDSLVLLDVAPEEIINLWSLLACILHIGNLQFVPGTQAGDPPVLVSPELGLSVETIAQNLGVSSEDLCKCLTVQKTSSSGRSAAQAAFKVLPAENAKHNSHAMIKWLYRSLFSWLVRKINSVYGKVAISAGGNVVKFIGILDIFGFESLLKNSFEQLCINYANERLHKQFNEHVFVLEQEQYRSQGIEWAVIPSRDNQSIIDLISEKPSGLFTILEEHCMLNLNRRPQDDKLLEAFNQAHDQIHPAYEHQVADSLTATQRFVVNHFAGPISYQIDDFIAKNNNTMPDEIVSVMTTSTNTFLLSAAMIGNLEPGSVGYIPAGQELNVIPTDPDVDSSESAVATTSKFSLAAERDRKASPTSSTVSHRFRNQLDMLMDTLNRTQFHYIKCIKPNDTKRAEAFDSRIVLQQIQYSGILELVRIKQEVSE